MRSQALVASLVANTPSITDFPVKGSLRPSTAAIAEHAERGSDQAIIAESIPNNQMCPGPNRLQIRQSNKQSIGTTSITYDLENNREEENDGRKSC